MGLFIIIVFSYLLLMLAISLVYGDIKAIFRGDPAAKNLEFLLYPSLYAVSTYRIYHLLFNLKIPFMPRLLSQVSRFFTFIEIHPGATIGRSFFIDHGDGVVIGETAIIGNNVILYHQVTLGGTGNEQGKRHPTIENNVIIGAGSKILGNITIGDHCKVGAGSVVLKDVPAHSTAVGNPARIANVKGVDPSVDFDLGHVPDPLKEEYVRLEKMVRDVTKSLKDCKKKND